LAQHAEQLCGGLVSPFGTVENPIRMMEREHREAGDELHMIRKLTRNYAAPEDGCTTYAVCMAELREFERDLHRHVHLENNVLFPRAIALENGSWRRDRG
jgi:regulator of cell morphogenesis and NO signaling